MRRFRGIATAAAVLALVLSLGMAAVYAEDATNMAEQSPDSSVSSDGQNASSGTTNSSQPNARGTTHQEIEKLRTEMKDAKEQARSIKDRLAGRRLKACENRQDAIKRILTRAATRGENHVALFSTITTRVEAFYKNKSKALSTYDQLVSEVAVKKTAAEAAITMVKNAGDEFTCSSDNPKAQISVFRTEIKAEVAALKEYRTAIKNLIVGVKSVQGASENGA